MSPSQTKLGKENELSLLDLVPCLRKRCEICNIDDLTDSVDCTFDWELSDYLFGLCD